MRIRRPFWAVSPGEVPLVSALSVALAAAELRGVIVGGEQVQGAGTGRPGLLGSSTTAGGGWLGPIATWVKDKGLRAALIPACF